MATDKLAEPRPAYRQPLYKQLLGIQEIGVILAIVVFFVVFESIDKSMGEIANMRTMALQGSMIGLAAFGMSFLMIVGEIDLSAGAVAGLTAAIVGILAAQVGWPELACYATGLVVAALVGLVNAFVVLRVRMPSFFATLGASFLATGLGIWLLKGAWISMGDQIPLAMWWVSASPVFGLPYIFLALLPAYIIGDLLIRFTKLGPTLTAVGGNRQAAEIVGINVPLVKTLCFVFVSVCAGLAGIAVMAYGTITDAYIGSDWMLWIIAIAIIGGGSLRGGVGSIVGALLGTVLVEIIRTGLFNAQVKTNAQGIVIGGVLIGAAILDVIRRKTAQY
jgi:ribose transport system permease protein